jgi:hypothetical protein
MFVSVIPPGFFRNRKLKGREPLAVASKLTSLPTATVWLFGPCMSVGGTFWLHADTGLAKRATPMTQFNQSNNDVVR